MSMDEVTKPTPGTYSVRAVCTNCGYRGKITLPVGKERPNKTKCPMCDCLTYVRPID